MIGNIINILFGVATASAQSDKVSTLTSETNDQFQSLFNTIIMSIPYWFMGIIIIILSFIVSRVVKSSVENRMMKAGIDEEHPEIQLVVVRTTSVLVMTLGVTIGLKIMGLDLTPIIAAGAFGIGFALKDIIVNFLAGIIVLLQKQFTIGDWIKVKGACGNVEQIQSRYTVIKTWNGTKVIIPNSDLFKNQVTSYTGYPTRRFVLSLGVDFYYDLKETIEQLYESIDKVNSILKSPKPSILVKQPGPYYNELSIRCWVESRKGVLKPTSALMRQIHKDFYGRGWSWPFPTQTIALDKDDRPNMSERHHEYMEKQKAKNLSKDAIAVGSMLPGNADSPEYRSQTGNTPEQQPKISQKKEYFPPQSSAQNQAPLISAGANSDDLPLWLKKAQGAKDTIPVTNAPIQQIQEQSMYQQTPTYQQYVSPEQYNPQMIPPSADTVIYPQQVIQPDQNQR